MGDSRGRRPHISFRTVAHESGQVGRVRIRSYSRDIDMEKPLVRSTEAGTYRRRKIDQATFSLFDMLFLDTCKSGRLPDNICIHSRNIFI